MGKYFKIKVLSNTDENLYNLSFLTAAEVHIMSLLEYIKHQQEQIIAKVNILTSRMNTSGPEIEMSDPVQFPLGNIEAVDDFEEWLKNPANSQVRQNVVSLSSAILFHVCIYHECR